MSTIGHGYGSEWHLLRYLGYHRNRLNGAILNAINAHSADAIDADDEAIASKKTRGIDWQDFRFSSVRKPLQDDRELGGMNFFLYSSQRNSVEYQWREYWPASEPGKGAPPKWDAVGRIPGHTFLLDSEEGVEEWLLVEAKAHLGELETRYTGSDKSLGMIRRAMESTAKTVTHGGIPTDAWLNTYYQYANRLALLNFFCQVNETFVPTRLIFIYFYGELMADCKCPQTQDEWEAHLATVHSALDLNLQAPLMQRVHEVFIPVNPGGQRSSRQSAEEPE